MTLEADKMAIEAMKTIMWVEDFHYDGTPIKNIVVKQIPASFARQYIASFHYSHTMPDSTLYSFGAYLNGKTVGVVCYGMGCNKNQYTSIIPDIENGRYCELTRLWVAKDYPKNTESLIISKSLKLLPKDIQVVLSFADPSKGHCGIIYQATNWIYLGETNSGKMLFTKEGIQKHVRSLGIYRLRHPELRSMSNNELVKMLGYTYGVSEKKYRYVMFRGSKCQRAKMLSLVKDRILPYPKLDKKKDEKDEMEMINSAEMDLERCHDEEPR